jgi:hypothetical protein
MKPLVTWRSDIDALAFQPDGGQRYCVVHRRAFRTLLGFNPSPADCESFFHANRDAFQAAASAKTLAKKLARGLNFHLTSRDVARRIELAKRSRLG